jgi:hypothetical protein
MTFDDLADLPPRDAHRAVDTKGPDRQAFAYRGTFVELDEAIAIATSSTEPRYVAMGPGGGYSVFRMREFPWGDVEGDSAASWPADQVVVFLPPAYGPEPCAEALKAHRIGPRRGSS